jgi:kynurenine formamidase
LAPLIGSVAPASALTLLAGWEGIALRHLVLKPLPPGVRHVSNQEVHHICGEMGFTHYENIVNLYQLVGRGRFRFIGLPLKIRGGTGSPVRAVAVFEE